MTPFDESHLATVLQSLLGAVDQNERAAADSVAHLEFFKSGIEAIHQNNPDRFHLFVTSRLDKVARGIIATATEETHTDLTFLFEQADFVARHFRRLIEIYEGSACCADKTRTILGALSRYFSAGSPIIFDYAGEVTYHLPKTVFTTQGDIVLFFEALKHLYYGRPEPYLERLPRVAPQAIPKDVVLGAAPRTKAP